MQLKNLERSYTFSHHIMCWIMSSLFSIFWTWMTMSILLCIGSGMMALKWLSCRWNVNNFALDYGKVQSLFWYGVESMFVFFHRKKMKIDDCLSIWWFVEQRSANPDNIVPGEMPPQRNWNVICWTYVPDHLILKTAVCEGKEIIVMFSVSQLHDIPATQISQTSVSSNYSG